MWQQLVERAGSLLNSAVVARAGGSDLDQRDPDFIREWLPGTWLLATLWHRTEVRGLDRIPEEGPVLLVGNHSGGNVAPDTLAFTLAFVSYFGVERRFYQLAHNLILAAPHLSWLRKFGTVSASRANSVAALASGAALLVYPGGDMEVHRPSWQSGKVDFAGRCGFVDLALDHEVPIVPVVAIGGQETAVFLTRGERLAHLLGLDRFLRLKVLPISLSLPWGLNVGDFLGHFPLPAKLTIQVLDPVCPRQSYGPHPDRQVVGADITARMQRCLDRLAAERRFPVLG
jgi:1-acyl-sn-glycerol-3-phosphate acyltransferase